MSRAMTRDELVEFAIFLYGPKWQSPLAKELGVKRQFLVRDLASDEPIAETTARRVLELVDARIAQMKREQDELRHRVDKLKREMNIDMPSRTKRGSGREVAS